MSASNPAHEYLRQIGERAPVVKQTLADYGSASLADYLRHVVSNTATPYQSADDLLEIVYGYAAPLLGETIAEQTTRDLRDCPVILTTNHHGVDFFAQSVQGCLMFSQRRLSNGERAATTPVFACGNVPLNNLTYPRGFLIYQVAPDQLAQLPLKLPIFPDRLKREMVSTVSGFDAAMLARAAAKVEKLGAKQHIEPAVAQALQTILREDYGVAAVAVSEHSLYSQQAVQVSQQIWQRLFSQTGSAPALVYLEIEKIAKALLQADLANPNSLAWQVMFDPRLRDDVLQALDGSKVCWDRQKLQQREQQLAAGDSVSAPEGGGTVFFWGIDERGKRIPLNLTTSTSNQVLLQGCDDKGQRWQLPFTPAAISQALQDNKLLPALFNCYLTIALARGVSCAGGYYQAEYLPFIQRGVVSALHQTGDYEQAAKCVASTPTDRYMAGIQAVMCRLSDGALVPAGLAEMSAAGGLSQDDLARMMALSVYDTHLASLLETLPDVMPGELGDADWKRHVVSNYGALLDDKMIIINDQIPA